MTLYPGTIAAAQPGRAAVVFGDTTLSYAGLDQASAAIAAMLHAHGLTVGDTIAMLIGNRPEFFTVAWAAQRSGLYYVPIPTRLTPGEVRYILADSGAKALFVDPAYAALARDATRTMPIVQFDLTASGAEHPPAPELEGGDMLYTSGTTGLPKGVRRPLTGEALGSDGKRVGRARDLFGLDRDSIFLSPAPLYHAAPLRFAMNLLRVGGTVVGMERFDAAGALALIAAHRVTHSQWVPTMFSRLLGLTPHQRTAHDLSSHRVAIHAGAPCAPGLKHAMIDWWGPILHEYCSGTESVGFTHVTSPEWLARPGTVGRPFGCTVHIVADDGTELGHGHTGAVYFGGKGGLSYHNDTAKTAAAHDPRGWATMGDIGYLDADGYLFLTDRRAFTIISGGVNIYPVEVEAALATHPAVRDVAVFGLPDADLGEQVFALVELEAGQVGDAVLAQAIADHIAPLLARHKRPRRIAFGSAGRTETGKLLKARLRDAHTSGEQGFPVTTTRNSDRARDASAAG